MGHKLSQHSTSKTRNRSKMISQNYCDDAQKLRKPACVPMSSENFYMNSLFYPVVGTTDIQIKGQYKN